MRKLTKRSWSSRLTRGLAVAVVCSTTVLGVGCKSSMPTWKTPSWNSFGFKKEPSPDALAGVGPTATYPLSPSATATPNAIQSVAASPSGVQPQTSQVANAATTRPSGTSPANPAGLPPTTGNLASSTNPTAASANGFGAQPPAVSPGTSYVHGRSPAIPPAAGGQAAAMPTYAAAQTVTRPPSSNYASVGYPMPGSAPTPGAVSASIASAPMPAPMSTAIPPTGAVAPPSLAGFAMPSGSATTPATPSAPIAGGFEMPAQTAGVQIASTPPVGGFVMPALGGIPVEKESEPEARTATATSTTPTSAVAPAGAYAPGSTSGARSYPASSSGGSSDAGTFYR